MRIPDRASDMQIRTEATKPVRPAATEAGARPAAPAPSAPRADKVQISDAGRALAANAGGGAVSGLSAERTADIRQRVLHGAYDSLDVVDTVARRLLETGDV